jgi:uncharacterized protein YdbL (DUF1318 family)
MKTLTKINRIPLFAIVITVILTACVTVNIYFPAAEVKKAAEDIAREVRGGVVDNAPQDKSKTSPTSWLNFSGIAHAQQELTLSNSTIRQIKKKMKDRLPAIEPYLKNGNLGEALNGFLVLKNTGGLDLRKTAEVKRLIKAENSDREDLYNAVSSALNVPASEEKRVNRIFAGEWQKTAPNGTWIEKEKDKWSRK